MELKKIKPHFAKLSEIVHLLERVGSWYVEGVPFFI
jgi:hypothetical protein